MPSDLNLIKKAHVHPRAHTYVHALTKKKNKKKKKREKKNRQQMATRPLDLSPERASWGETKKRQRRKRWRGGRQRSKEIRGEKGKRERWERVLSWCDF